MVRGRAAALPRPIAGSASVRHRIQSHRRRRHRRQSHEGSIASKAKSGCSPCQQAETSLAGQINGHPGPNLPEDIWCQIHSLLPMRDAARVACVSHAFEQSWRYHPNLVFNEETLGINVNTCRMDEKMRYFTSKVDCILKKHSGIGIRVLKLKVGGVRNAKDCHHLDSWLHRAVKPGIEELNLQLSVTQRMYRFPYSLLSGGTGDSLRHLLLTCCRFHPTELVCLKSLTRLDLFGVCISDDELECLLSNSFSLEQLKLHCCDKIVCLKIPCLQKLSSLEVNFCSLLQVIENKAPNLSNFQLSNPDALPLRGTRPIKKLCISFEDSAFYALTELPSSMPSLETLSIISYAETIGTPMVNSKFLHLKFLDITFAGYGYDYLSLVSFFDSSPSLETFYLNVSHCLSHNVSIFQDPLNLRTVPEQVHEKLKRVEIINFLSAKSLIELTCHIVQSARSLERLTLDTTSGNLWPRCSVNKSAKCFRMDKDDLVEAHRAILAVQTYIKPNVPPTVELNVVEPCNRCHADL